MVYELGSKANASSIRSTAYNDQVPHYYLQLREDFIKKNCPTNFVMPFLVSIEETKCP